MNTLTTEENADTIVRYLDRELGIDIADPRQDPTTATELLAAVEVVAATATSDDPTHSHYGERCKTAIEELSAALRFVRGEITTQQYFETE